MKRIFYLSIILIFFNAYITPKTPHFALTHLVESWRRLGDNITTVTKMFYFEQACKKNKLTLYFRDFPYFDQFAISKHASLLTPEIEKQFSKKVTVNKFSDIEEHWNSSESILFECHFLSETPPLYSVTHQFPEFGTLVKKAFTPLIEVPSLAKPEAVITVALHVRKGGGYDKPLGSKQEYGSEHTLPAGFYLKKNSPHGSHMDAWPLKWPVSPLFIESVRHYFYKKTNFSDYIWPIKFPCDQYYIDCLKELAAMHSGKNLLVYIFTDDPNPEDIMERYSTQLIEHPRIIFSYRTKGNHHTKNVIEDLFSLTQCDCLISASSSFATIAQLLGNHQALMFPLWAVTMPNKIVITQIGVITLNEQENTTGYREIIRKIK